MGLGASGGALSGIDLSGADVVAGMAVTIAGDSSGAVQAFDRAQVALEATDKQLQQSQMNWEAVGTKMTAAGKTLSLAVTAPLMAASAASLKLAADAGETQSKFETVFGNMSADAETWAETFGTAAGRARTDMKATAATFGDVLQGMGATKEESLEFAEILTELGVDMASFSNTTDDSAWVSLRSAITGEYEAMKKYGVVLSAAAVDQELMNMGISGGTTEATNAEKAQARLNLIIAATSNAQGDAIRTADSFANQTKAMTADLQTLAEEVGEELIPIAQDGIDLARDGVAWFTSLDDGTQQLVVTAGMLAAAAGPTLIVGGKVISHAEDAYRAYQKVATQITTKTIPAIQAEIAALKAREAAAMASLATTAALGVGLAAVGVAAYALKTAYDETKESTEALDYAHKHFGKTTDMTTDELKEYADQMHKAADEVRELAENEQFADMIGQEFTEGMDGGAWAAGEFTARMYDNEGAVYDAATALDQYADVAEDALRQADDAYETHRKSVSALQKEYDALEDTINRALGIDEDIDDQNRSVERADIRLEQAKRDLADIEAEKEATERALVTADYDERADLQDKLTDLQLDHRTALLNVADAEDAYTDAQQQSSDLLVEKTALEDELNGESIASAQHRLTELQKEIDDETAALEDAYTAREAAQENYDAAVLALDQVTNTTLTDNWSKVVQFYQENPAIREVITEVYDEDGNIISAAPTITHAAIQIPTFTNPFTDTPVITARVPELSNPLAAASVVPPTATGSAPSVTATAQATKSGIPGGNVNIETLNVNSPAADALTMMRSTKRTLRDVGTLGVVG